jgi:phosphoribosylaminoimidazolecarboxamide formyltransferase/IMP cyclohydrolase
MVSECAYGENAYQKPASLYVDFGCPTPDKLAITDWILVAGNPLSYNNICDLDRMMQTITHIGAGFEKNLGKVPFVAIGAKHGNACGAAVAANEIEAVDKMLQGDLRAIFGGSVMLNFPIDEKIAEELIHKYGGETRRLLDVVAAPSFSAEAVEILSRKKGKCRLLANPVISKAGLSSLDDAERFRYVRGGFLLQPNYTFVPDIKNKDVLLAWGVGCTSNSNTITLVKDGRLYGNGVGQQDRVGAAKLALSRADEANKGKADLENAVAYSDSFFPFPDAVEVLINRGIKTIFSTSGSVNDDKIVELCKSKGVSLILLPDSEARGFYQH